MTSYVDMISSPIISIFRDGVKDHKSFIGNSRFFRNFFVEHYLRYHEEMNITLEDMRLSEKRQLWEESKVYCPIDREKWCMAWRFYQAL